MADKREFSALTQAVREAKLAAKIADLPKGLRKMAAILSEARGQVRSEIARGYLTGLTELVEALEEIPPRLWRQGIAEIDSIMRFASADDLLGDEDKQALQGTTNALKSEITRQSGLGVRTGNVLARGVKRLGENTLERGAGYYGTGGVFVRMASKLALSAIERRRETREAGKQFARIRSTALGSAASERSYGSRFADMDTEDTSPTRAGGDVEVEQLGELKKINRNLTKQIQVAQDIDEGNDKADALRESRAAYVGSEAALERDSMRLTFGEKEEQKEKPQSFFEKLMSMLGPLGGVIGNIVGAVGNAVSGLSSLAMSAASLAGRMLSLPFSNFGSSLLALAAAGYAAHKVWNWFAEKLPDASAGTLGGATAGAMKAGGSALRTGANLLRSGWNKGAEFLMEYGTRPGIQKGLGELGQAIAQRGAGVMETIGKSGVARWAGKSAGRLGVISAGVGAGMDYYDITEQERMIKEAEARGGPDAAAEIELRKKAIWYSKAAIASTVVEQTAAAATGTVVGAIPGAVGAAGGMVAGIGSSGYAAILSYQADKIANAAREKRGLSGPATSVGTPSDPTRGMRYDLYQQFPMLQSPGMWMRDSALPYSGEVGMGQGGVDDILNTIKGKESGGNYTLKNPTSSASGAYQFTDSTWRGLTRQYGIGSEFSRASDAPPTIQDAVAGRYVSDILRESGGDVSKVPLKWYTGNIEGTISSSALAGNRGLTPQQYQADWLNRYAGVTGSAAFAGATPSFSRNAGPVASQSSAAAGRGANVNVISAPVSQPVIINQGSGPTMVPMPIRTEPIENTLLAITRLNYV
jgi:hypothetical protein